MPGRAFKVLCWFSPGKLKGQWCMFAKAYLASINLMSLGYKYVNEDHDISFFFFYV